MSSIDLKVIEDLKQLDPENSLEMIKELVGMLFTMVPEKLTVIRDALKSGDFKSVTAAAHFLKSSTANLGARKMSSLCYELEQRSQTEPVDAKQLTDLFAELEKEYSQVRIDLAAAISPA